MNEKEFNPTAYKNEYAKEHYERINISLPKGCKQIVQELAKKAGLSTSQYIWSLIEKAKKADETS